MNIVESHDALRVCRITARNAHGRPIVRSDIPNYEEYDPIVKLCEYEDTQLKPSQIDKLFPHICSNCIGCEVEPEDGHGCDGKDNFVLSVERGYGHLLKLVTDDLAAKQKRWNLLQGVRRLCSISKEVQE